MATITASNPQRTNRWLLIGAAALALLAGIMVAVVLANTGGGGTTKTVSTTGTGDQFALVAKDTIPAGKKITQGMFDRVQVNSTVPEAVSDESVAIGAVPRVEILKGEQLSLSRIGLGSNSDRTFSPNIPDGRVAFTIPVDQVKSISGLIVPGDHVDLVATFKEKRGDQDVTRIETVLQNMQILAFTTDTIQPAAVKDASGTPVAGSSTASDQRRTDTKPNPSGSNVTLALTPQQVQTVAAVEDRGTLTLALRQLGDDSTHDLVPTYYGEFGPIPPTPTR